MIGGKNLLLHAFLAREMQVLETPFTGDIRADYLMLADNFLGKYADGFSTKADHKVQLKVKPIVPQNAISEHKLSPHGEAHCLLSYCADFQQRTCDRAAAMYVRTVFAKGGRERMNSFSEDALEVAL